MTDPGHTAWQLTPRERARRRARITLVFLAGFLAVALVLALVFAEKLIGTREPVRPAQAVCTPGPPAPTKVTINVYNATEHDGLGLAVSRKLAAQGFRIASVGNDPKAAKISAVAEVRFGTAGVKEAQAVALRLPGAKLVRDARKDTTVDVAIGLGYRRLATPPVPTNPC